MEHELILTLQEENIVEQIKKNCYYPSATICKDVENILSGLQSERKIFVLNSALNTVFFEQRQRRDYILSVLGSPKLNPPDDHLLIKAIAQPANKYKQLDQIGRELSIATPLQPITAPREVVEQAIIFNTADNALEEISSYWIAKNKVKPLLSLLQSLSPEDLDKLVTAIDSYFEQTSKLGYEVSFTNPPISSGIAEILAKVGLSVVIEKALDAGEKLEFLSLVLKIVRGITHNNKLPEPMSQEELQSELGRLLYFQGTPIRLDS